MQELGSKKWRTMVLAGISMVAAQQQHMPWYVVVVLGGLGAVYILSQGLADRGKEETKLILASVKNAQAILDKKIAEKLDREQEFDKAVEASKEETKS